MKKAMETVQDLIEEAQIRTVWWALCIFSVSYFLTHTSKSMWMNVPISVLIVCGLRILCNEVEFRWKVHNIRRQTYLSHLEKKQLSVNDSRLSTTPPPSKWKRKIDSPVVEAAMDEFVNKLLQDFVVDLWYSDITPDKEAPELIHAVVMDVLGEVSGRVKEINLVELLTRDIVDLIGKNLDLFRRNQAAIGMEVMGTLSSEERDERLKHHLLTSKDLHPALISSECEYKVLQRLTGGLLAVALRPREAQCPLIRCIARELLTCLVMQPLINLASPAYINELIEHILLALKEMGIKQIGTSQLLNAEGHKGHHVPADQHHVEAATNITTSHNKGTDLTMSRVETAKDNSLDGSGNSVTNISHNEAMHPRSAEWARVLEAATQRRTEVLMPENLENMWTIGRNYKKKVQKLSAGGQTPLVKGSDSSNALFTNSNKEILANKAEALARMEDQALTPTAPRPPLDSRPNNQISSTTRYTPNLNKVGSFKGNRIADESEDSTSFVASGNKKRLTRSNSTPDLNIVPELGTDSTSNSGGPIISEFYDKDFSRKSQAFNAKSASNMVSSSEGQHTVKLRCRVVGAYFEKLGSKSFAVYSIAVTDIDGITWFVKRRYRNFERLHRQLKDIPNYTLHLPPKRIFSSSTEDAFVHQRCIQLDKYLQDLLSIANVAEQHEVWDFLSASSKNYSFGKSPSVMKSLAVNVDDAMDDIVRQFKGVSDGLMRKVVSPSSSVSEPASSVYGRNLSLKEDEINKLNIRQHTANSVNSFSDNEEGDKSTNPYGEETGSSGQTSGWHSDNELNSKEFPPRVVKRSDEFRSVDSDEKDFSTMQSESFSPRASRGVKISLTSEQLDDPIGVPPEWTPPNLSVPLLNLVDNVFQLKRRGWLRRQVFWISKQILQLMMEDAIDDWLLMQIHWLRREDTIAQGIRWIQDVLWPGGKFFLKLHIRSKMDDNEMNDISLQSTSVSASSSASKPGSFELQLEAARRASNVKKMILSWPTLKQNTKEINKLNLKKRLKDYVLIEHSMPSKVFPNNPFGQSTIVILRNFTESGKCIDVCRISGGAPTPLVSLIGHKQYKRCARDIYYFIQSAVCLKQVTYEILELVLVSIFPEMRDVVMDMHEKMQAQPL